MDRLADRLAQGSEEMQTRFAQSLLIGTIGLGECQVTVFQRETGLQCQAIFKDRIANEDATSEDFR